MNATGGKTGTLDFSGTFRAVLYLLITTPIAILLGLFLGRWLLPLVQAAVFFPLFLHLLRRGPWSRVVGVSLLWALVTTAVMILLSWKLPAYAEPRILLAESYRLEMFTWIATGQGPEGDIRQFLPQHILHFLVFAAATALSAGFLGLVMGSVLMNYMSFYVGSLLVESNGDPLIWLIGWHPWAVVRVVAFIIAATVLSSLSLDRVGVVETNWEKTRRYLALALGLLLLDVLLKWVLAPYWQQWLAALTKLQS